jgi:hypothetical protein
MVHIDLAPLQPIPESVLDKTIIEIHTKDNSHPPTSWKLYSLCRLQLHQITSLMSMPSHGIPCFDFCKQMMQQYEQLKTTSQVAIYYYQKIIL